QRIAAVALLPEEKQGRTQYGKSNDDGLERVLEHQLVRYTERRREKHHQREDDGHTAAASFGRQGALGRQSSSLCCASARRRRSGRALDVSPEPGLLVLAVSLLPGHVSRGPGDGPSRCGRYPPAPTGCRPQRAPRLRHLHPTPCRREFAARRGKPRCEFAWRDRPIRPSCRSSPGPWVRPPRKPRGSPATAAAPVWKSGWKDRQTRRRVRS